MRHGDVVECLRLAASLPDDSYGRMEAELVRGVRNALFSYTGAKMLAEVSSGAQSRILESFRALRSIEGNRFAFIEGEAKKLEQLARRSKGA